MSHPDRRKRKLVNPSLQLRWALTLALATGVGVFAQALLLIFTLSRLAQSLPNDGEALIASIPAVLVQFLLLSAVLLFPLLLILGILLSFRIAGPIHRMQGFLTAIVAGERPIDCKLRKGDDFHDLCELLNQATRPVRSAAPEQSELAA